MKDIFLSFLITLTFDTNFFFCWAGEEEYDMRAIGSTMLIVVLILLPLLLIIFCTGGHVYRKMRKDGSAVSWNYTTNSRRGSLLRLDSTTQLRKNEPVQQTQSAAASPTTSSPNDNRIPLTYDGVYVTNEPLPNKPMIEFEPKIWDITDDDLFASQSKLSSPGSVSQRGHPSRNIDELYSKPIKPKKQKIALEQQQAPYRSASVDYLEPANKPVRSQSIETDIF